MNRSDASRASKLAKSVDDLGFDMLRFYHSKLGTKNILVSPLSLLSCGAITANIYDGQTRKEFLKAVGCPNLELPNESMRSWITKEMRSSKSPISVNNALFLRPSLKPSAELAATLDNSYRCEQIELVENKLKAKDRVADWVSKTTRGRVSPNLPSFSSELRFTVANAIWFKCDWQFEFQKSKTREEDFTLTSGAKVIARMMSFEKGVKTSYGYDPGDYVVLPYADGDFAMVLIKPRERKSISDLLKSLNADILKEMLMANSDLVVSPTVPQFSIGNALDLNSFLKDRGVKNAYRMQQIKSLSSRQPMMLMSILQCAWIKVDEEGTEAGVATEGFHGCAKSGPLDFNEPFIYILCHQPSNSIVFLGICADPTAKSEF